MALSTQPYKGARDFYPEDKRVQKYMFKTVRKAVEGYGYEEYDAPILELEELFTSKTSDEIVNEQTYSFVDRGGRNVVIRPEMTPSVSRMVAAKRQELAYPLRWYSIPNLWRYERPQRGRLREHWQLNVDLFGIEGLAAEHEVIQVADSIYQSFKAKRSMYSIHIGSRRLLNFIMDEYLGLNKVQANTLIQLIDRMNKMEHGLFVAELEALFTPTQRDQKLPDELERIIKASDVSELPLPIKSHPAAEEIEQLISLLAQSGVVNTVFDLAIVRGFDYYTGIVFEVVDADPENNRSMMGGGRYDGLVGMFGVEPVPTVGFGLGDVTLKNFLESHNLLREPKNEADAYIVLIGDIYNRAHIVAQNLRKLGLNVAIDPTERKPAQQIKTAVKKGIKYAVIIGEEELAEERYVLKNLDTGEEEKHSAERIVTLIKDYRKQ